MNSNRINNKKTELLISSFLSTAGHLIKTCKESKEQSFERALLSLIDYEVEIKKQIEREKEGATVFMGQIDCAAARERINELHEKNTAILHAKCDALEKFIKTGNFILVTPLLEERNILKYFIENKQLLTWAVAVKSSSICGWLLQKKYYTETEIIKIDEGMIEKKYVVGFEGTSDYSMSKMIKKQIEKDASNFFITTFILIYAGKTKKIKSPILTNLIDTGVFTLPIFRQIITFLGIHLPDLPRRLEEPKKDAKEKNPEKEIPFEPLPISTLDLTLEDWSENQQESFAMEEGGEEEPVNKEKKGPNGLKDQIDSDNEGSSTPASSITTSDLIIRHSMLCHLPKKPQETDHTAPVKSKVTSCIIC